MLPLTRSRNRARFFGAPFSPEALFAGGTVAGAWYDPSDLSTMFTTSAGTTQCAMPGQGSAVSVGLMLDKSQGLQRFWSGYFDGSGDNLQVANNAAFQFGTGDFTAEGWIYQTETSGYRIIAQCADNGGWTNGWTFAAEGTNRRLELWVNGSGIASTSSVLSANAWTHVAVTRSGSTITFWVNGVASGTASSSANLVPTRDLSVGNQTSASFLYQFAGYISNLRVVKGTAVYTGNFTPPSPVTGLTAISGTSLLTCQNSTFIDNSSNAFAITVNGNTTTSQNIPLGNHAIAFNDTTARPELRARVNLLTYSEEFDNGAWAKFGLNAFGSGSVANTTATLDPLGGNTADYIQENTAAASHLVMQGASVGANVQTVFSVYMKAAQRTWGVIYPETSGGAGAGVWFNLATGVVGTQGAGRVGSIASVGNGWYRCSVVATLSTDSQRFYLGPASADNTVSYTGDGTSGIYIWGADFRPANIGANVPAYQRIADANTYDTSGFPLYLRFDGIDDSMYTPANLNLSGTDKVTVFAGVRKLSDAAAASLVEFSANTSLNTGTFATYAPGSAAANYVWRSYGTTTRDVTATTFSAPITNVLTGIGNIGGDISQLRSNGSVAGTNTGDQGAGNFGAYPLYIGSRGNSSLWLNGHIHSLIIAGSAVSAGNISATEQWVAGKTGITI